MPQILLFNNETEIKLPALIVQEETDLTPEYSIELYRLFLVMGEHTEAILEGQPIRLRKFSLLTLSPGEKIEFNDYALLQSIAFHHNFFCIRVMREEVFCDGIVFNRLSGLPVVEFPETELSILKSRFEELRKIIEAKGPFTNDRALNVIRTFLLHVAEFKLKSTKKHHLLERQVKHLSPLVLAFQHLVEENFKDRRDASFYSEKLSVSNITLNRKVKQELGLTIMQVANERLAIEARVALRSGKRSVKEVAFDLGFSDPLYFSRFFRKHFGSPPSQYFLSAVK